MRYFIRTISLLLVFVSLFGMTFSMSGCHADEIGFYDIPSSMQPGEVFDLGSNYHSKVGDLDYHSDHPEVAWVDENGVLTAVKPGVAHIVAWAKKNPKLQEQFYLNVQYEVESEVKEPSLHSQSSIIYGPDFMGVEDRFYYDIDGYSDINKEWDISDAFHELRGKGQHEYMFSSPTVCRVGSVSDACLYVYADKSQSDVMVSVEPLKQIDFREFFANHIALSAEQFAQEQVHSATNEIITKIDNITKRMQNTVWLSTLDKSCSYKVSVKVSYEVYAINDYYSNGKLKDDSTMSLESVQGMGMRAFLNNYTYLETTFVVSCYIDDVDLTIEKCPVEG